MSILRTSKFVKYFSSVARNIALKPAYNVDGLLSAKAREIHVISKLSTAYAASHRIGEHSFDIDRSIRRLDEDARRVGRISRRELEDVIEEIRQSKSATSTQSLMVIRCCGNLVPEELPEFRTKLVKNVWEILEKLGVPMDISHYNALLRVYLENEHHFSSAEFLAELESKGIEPNRVTYQRLIAGYCQKGDIDGATKILEFMREKQMPISEGVFNALILGHSKAGDMQSARGIIGVMSQAGLEPSADTYSALLCGYASTGDSETMESIFTECETKDIVLTDKDYLEVVYILAVNNHDGLIDSVLRKAYRGTGYNQDAANIILRLTTNGKEKAAYQVFETMITPTLPDSSVANFGSFFIRQMVKANRPVENILNICDKLKEGGYNNRSILIATETALTSNTNLALELLKAMIDNFYPIRNHYFWPLFVQSGKQGESAVLDVLKVMSDFKVIPSTETIKDYVIPNLVKNTDGINVNHIFSSLVNSGISTGSAASGLVSYFIAKKKIKEAAEIVSRFRANYSYFTIRSLVAAYLHTPDTDSFVKIIQAIVASKVHENREPTADESEFVFDERELVGKILLELINRSEAVLLDQLLEKLLKAGLGISNSTAEQIQAKLTGNNLTSEVSLLLSKLVSDDLSPVRFLRERSSTFTPRNEESYRNLIEKLKSKGEPTNSLKKQLFNYFCAEKDVNKLTSYQKELEDDGFTFVSGMHAQLIEVFLFHNDLDSALNEFKILKEKEPDVKLDNIKAIKLATGLVQADRLDDAIDFLKNQVREENDIEKEKEKAKPFIYTSSCWRLLNTLAEKGDTAGVKRLFETLVENKFIEISNVLLGPLVKAHLVNDDLKGAMEVYEWCCNSHRATPFKNELACKFIQKEDAEQLQKLTDLSTIVHGEINSLHDLIIAFVECGRIRQARKILETPGLRVKTERLSFAGERYQSEGLVEPLEGLLKATKDITQVDRSTLFYQLLMSYVKANAVDKAIGVWTQMQEEDVQPSELFLYELGTFLESKNQPVPFVIPKKPAPTEYAELSDGTNSSKAHLALRNELLAKNWKGAIDAYENLKKADTNLYPSESGNLLILGLESVGPKETTKYLKEWLLDSNVLIPVRKLHYFLKNLANTGDVEIFDDIGNFLSDNQKRNLKFNNLKCSCYGEAGKIENLFLDLEKNVENASEEQLDIVKSNFPKGGILSILEKNPELYSRVEEVAQKYLKRGILAPMNVLWLHLLTQNDPKACDIFNEHVKNLSSVSFRYVLTKARNSLDTDLLDRLLSSFKETYIISNQALGVIHSAKLDVLVMKNEPEEALSHLKDVLKTVPLESINYTSLRRLKVALTPRNIDFPYEIKPNYSRKGVADDASSDSDDEDVRASEKT